MSIARGGAQADEPARPRLFGLKAAGGRLEAGYAADLMLFDPGDESGRGDKRRGARSAGRARRG